MGCKLDAESKRLRLANVGLVKVLLHRPLEGTPKTATISRSSTGKWYVCFSCECAAPAPLPATGVPVGIDVGLKTFATLSTGAEIANPRFFRHEEQALAKAQRRLANEAQGTPERAKRRRVVARVHERVAWRRSDFAHQHSRAIVNTFDLIAVEDLAINRMTAHPVSRQEHQRRRVESVHVPPFVQGSMGRSQVCGREPRVHLARLLAVWPSAEALPRRPHLHLPVLRAGARP